MKIRSEMFKTSKLQNSLVMEAEKDRKVQNKLLEVKPGQFMKGVV